MIKPPGVLQKIAIYLSSKTAKKKHLCAHRVRNRQLRKNWTCSHAKNAPENIQLAFPSAAVRKTRLESAWNNSAPSGSHLPSSDPEIFKVHLLNQWLSPEPMTTRPNRRKPKAATEGSMGGSGSLRGFQSFGKARVRKPPPMSGAHPSSWFDGQMEKWAFTYAFRECPPGS